MVKECMVKVNNDSVTVVKYGEKDIQFPSIHKDAKVVYVKREFGKYIIVDKQEYEKQKPAYKFMSKQKEEKKTTIDTNTEDIGSV